ncbi:hypothetical protein [Mongoliimonas terrestris]|uniref:hypothetical protein n=1 Tax=Mongoliimonas terrestris TaxID=1709001 RepID=UPI000AF8AEA4|nr:hypothetical protein [Mongoliimonas terrestris]
MTCLTFDDSITPLNDTADERADDLSLSTGASIVVAVAAAIAVTLTIIVATLSVGQF